MAELDDLAEAIRAQLATIAGLRAHAYAPDNVHPPCAYPVPTTGTYENTLSSAPSTTFEIVVLAAPFDPKGLARAQKTLNGLLARTGAGSIRAALRADVTLDGNADTLDVGGWREYESLAVNGVEYLGARIDLEIWH